MMSHLSRCEVAGVLDYFFPDDRFGMQVHRFRRRGVTVKKAEEEGMVAARDLLNQSFECEQVAE